MGQTERKMKLRSRVLLIFLFDHMGNRGICTGHGKRKANALGSFHHYVGFPDSPHIRNNGLFFFSW